MLLKKLKPSYNRGLRIIEDVCTWRLLQHGEKWSLALLHTDSCFGDKDNFFGSLSRSRKVTNSSKAIADARVVSYLALVRRSSHWKNLFCQRGSALQQCLCQSRKRCIVYCSRSGCAGNRYRPHAYTCDYLFQEQESFGAVMGHRIKEQ